MRVVNGDAATVERKFIFIVNFDMDFIDPVTVKHEFCAVGCIKLDVLVWIDIYNGAWYNLDATDQVTIGIDVFDIFNGMAVTTDILILISFLDTYIQ